MKIIHCADLHLDSKMTANLSKEKAKERKSELLMTFQNMIEYAVKNEVKAIIIAGDLFDTKNISATARNTVCEAIVNHSNIDFYYLKGNHDEVSPLADMAEQPMNLKMFKEEWTSYVMNEKGNVVLSGVELNANNANSIYSSLVLDGEKFNIVTLHGQESEYVGKDKTECVHLRELRNKGIDYLALGHIHQPKKDALDSRGTYCYCGCLEGRGFDECGERGFMLLEIDEEERTSTSTFVPFASRQLYTLQIDVSDTMTTAQMAGRIRTALEEKEYSFRSLLKLVLVGELDVECEKDVDLLVKQFEDGYYFLKIYDETKLKVDYQAFSLDQSLKGEFVRTVMNAQDLDEEEKAEIIRYGIQALAGEEVQ